MCKYFYCIDVCYILVQSISQEMYSALCVGPVEHVVTRRTCNYNATYDDRVVVMMIACVCVRACVCVYVHVCACACACVCVCACMCACKCMYMCMLAFELFLCYNFIGGMYIITAMNQILLGR